MRTKAGEKKEVAREAIAYHYENTRVKAVERKDLTRDALAYHYENARSKAAEHHLKAKESVASHYESVKSKAVRRLSTNSQGNASSSETSDPDPKVLLAEDPPSALNRFCCICRMGVSS